MTAFMTVKADVAVLTVSVIYSPNPRIRLVYKRNGTPLRVRGSCKSTNLTTRFRLKLLQSACVMACERRRDSMPRLMYISTVDTRNNVRRRLRRSLNAPLVYEDKRRRYSPSHTSALLRLTYRRVAATARGGSLKHRVLTIRGPWTTSRSSLQSTDCWHKTNAQYTPPTRRNCFVASASAV